MKPLYIAVLGVACTNAALYEQETGVITLGNIENRTLQYCLYEGGSVKYSVEIENEIFSAWNRETSKECTVKDITVPIDIQGYTTSLKCEKVLKLNVRKGEGEETALPLNPEINCMAVKIFSHLGTTNIAVIREGTNRLRRLEGGDKKPVVDIYDALPIKGSEGDTSSLPANHSFGEVKESITLPSAYATISEMSIVETTEGKITNLWMLVKGKVNDVDQFDLLRVTNKSVSDIITLFQTPASAILVGDKENSSALYMVSNLGGKTLGPMLVNKDGRRTKYFKLSEKPAPVKLTEEITIADGITELLHKGKELKYTLSVFGGMGGDTQKMEVSKDGVDPQKLEVKFNEMNKLKLPLPEESSLRLVRKEKILAIFLSEPSGNNTLIEEIALGGDAVTVKIPTSDAEMFTGVIIVPEKGVLEKLDDRYTTTTSTATPGSYQTVTGKHSEKTTTSTSGASKISLFVVTLGSVLLASTIV